MSVVHNAELATRAGMPVRSSEVTDTLKAMESRFANPGDVGHFLHYGGSGGTHELDHDFVVVDVETSGLDPAAGARVIEIAAVRINQAGLILDSMSSLVNPEDGNTGADWIHGITADMVKDAPTFDQVFDDFARVMDNAIFVAHHAKFDESFVAAETQLAGAKLLTMPAICTYWLARNTVKGTDNFKLGTLATHFEISQESAHTALDDAKVVAQILPKMLADYKALTYFTNPTPQPRIGNSCALMPR
jgi:DNA polymerase-3 subunit epsilon